jgi:hypothetical protein
MEGYQETCEEILWNIGSLLANCNTEDSGNFRTKLRTVQEKLQGNTFHIVVISDRLGRKRVIRLGWLIYVVACIGFALAQF